MTTLELDEDEREALRSESAAQRAADRACSCGYAANGDCAVHGTGSEGSLLEHVRILRSLYLEGLALRRS